MSSEVAVAPVATLPDATATTPTEPPAQDEARRRVTVRDILDRRAKAGRLVAGTAAYSDSDMFKGPSLGKPKAKRWDHHLSRESLAREPCVLKSAAKFLKNPGMISLGGGLPRAEYFPFESLTMRVPGGEYASSPSPDDGGLLDVTIGKFDATGPSATGTYDLAIGLNYGQAVGSAQLLRWVTEHTELVCQPAFADWRASLTVGSTGALEQALRMLCDRARGDALLTEQYSFSTALETMTPLGVPVFGVPMDAEGLLPDAMDAMLSAWDPCARGGARKPHVLYTVPSGQNPTGATMSAARRREVYEVARKHDLYILEDEPYYFLQMPPYVPGGEGQADEKNPTTTNTNVDEFLESLAPTLLSIDVDGRVMRLDSFSKVVVPGSRVGWITGSEQMVERFIRHAEVCNQGPAGFSQVALYKLLDETWGHEGYLRWVMNLRREYTRRRNVMLAACDRFLPREVASWTPPAAGMFLWMKIDHTSHPDFPARSLLEIEESIFHASIAKGALVARGSWFRAERDVVPEDMFFRATFAAATPEDMTEAIRRFGAAVRESFRI